MKGPQGCEKSAPATTKAVRSLGASPVVVRMDSETDGMPTIIGIPRAYVRSGPAASSESARSCSPAAPAMLADVMMSHVVRERYAEKLEMRLQIICVIVLHDN